jgi:hypothetical protein
MLNPISKIEKVKRETLISKAKGDAFNRLSDFYGFKKPQFISEDAWRIAIRSSVFGARGTFGTILAFLEGAFSEWIQFATYDMQAMSPNILNNENLGGDNCAYINRFVRIDGKMYFVSGESNLGYLVLDNLGTSYWNKANLVTGQVYEVSFLPFLIEEYGCQFKITIDSSIIQAPASYLRTDSEDRENDPYGSHVLDLGGTTSEEKFGDPLGDGAFPIYFGDFQSAEIFFSALNLLLVAGVHESMITQKWCNEYDIWGGLYNKKAYGTVSTEIPIVSPSRN